MKIRLDKYIWAVRLCKTRSQASELITQGKVLVNDARCKPSKEVKLGEIITILKHNDTLSIQNPTITKGLEA